MGAGDGGYAALPSVAGMAPPLASGAALSGAPAVAQMVAPGQAPPMSAAPSSADFLQNMDGLFVRQNLELAEALTGCEVKNRYTLTPIPLGHPDPTPPEWVQSFKQQAQLAPLLNAREDSECFERICCPLFRGFTMPFLDATGRSFITIERPFHCDPCYAPPCCTCATQALVVRDASGAVLSTAAEQSYTPCGAQCCSHPCERRFDTMDASGNKLYTLKVNECGSSRGSNCFAPSCCNENYDVDVVDAAGHLVSTSTYVFPGCNCAGLTEMTNALVRFPPNATTEQRAALLGGMYLVEFAHMELRKQQNNNN